MRHATFSLVAMLAVVTTACTAGRSRHSRHRRAWAPNPRRARPPRLRPRRHHHRPHRWRTGPQPGTDHMARPTSRRSTPPPPSSSPSTIRSSRCSWRDVRLRRHRARRGPGPRRYEGDPRRPCDGRARPSLRRRVELIEDTLDWYARDVDGNVWYFGEETAEYENGVGTSTAGSWEAGVDGAPQPGTIKCLQTPAWVTSIAKEFYAGEAEDRGRGHGRRRARSP